MSQQDIIWQIKEVGKRVLPKGAHLLLYGSRARGDAHDDSDWDLLVLVPMDKLLPQDYDAITYPFSELGWKINQQINPIMYTQKEWSGYDFTPFYQNVLADSIRLQ